MMMPLLSKTMQQGITRHQLYISLSCSSALSYSSPCRYDIDRSFVSDASRMTTSNKLQPSSTPNVKHDNNNIIIMLSRMLLPPKKNKFHNINDNKFCSFSTLSNNLKSKSNDDGESNNMMTLAEYLDPNSKIFPSSHWIHVKGFPPNGSLDMIVNEIENILQQEMERNNIIDLDAKIDVSKFSSKHNNDNNNSHSDDNNVISKVSIPANAFPVLPYTTITDTKEPDEPSNKELNRFITAAHVTLSNYGRPNGWYIQFRNRSITNAILTRAQEQTIYCSWKPIEITEYKTNEIKRQSRWSSSSKTARPRDGTKPIPFISDATIRVENCPRGFTKAKLYNLFSRFDVKNVLIWDFNNNQQYDTVLNNNKNDRRNGGDSKLFTYLVEFEDASWARAALRELQHVEFPPESGHKLLLAQFPKQILAETAKNNDNNN